MTRPGRVITLEQLDRPPRAGFVRVRAAKNLR